jgi:natural product precursor
LTEFALLVLSFSPLGAENKFLNHQNVDLIDRLLQKKSKKIKYKILTFKKIKLMKNIKLNAIEANKLKEKQMNNLKGGSPGTCCGCACAYANQGGSSDAANGNANKASGLNSPQSIKRYNCDGTWVILVP